MGLDMYLSAKRYIWSRETELSEKVAELLPAVGNRRVKEIAVEAMYWRKANAIHKWFVDNVQEGVDNCEKYYVSREALEQLLALIRQALADRDPALLLPSAGFFFGSTEVDQFYWDMLSRTEEQLQSALDDFVGTEWEFEYESSW